MRWRRRKPEQGPSRADEALDASRRQAADARAERRRWEELAARLRRIREENHLAERFRDALEGPR